MRTNRLILKEWLKAEKKADSQIEAKMLLAVRISISSWKKILYVDGWLPNSQTRLLLSQFTGIEESLLFPSPEDKAA